ncbi:MAG TPA: hypothetical protein VGC34_13715 [Steroidobacteraceae bacterium]
MPELLRKQVSAGSTRVRVLAWTLGAFPALAALPTLAAPETLPASVRACAAETDSLRRLMCYDKEVARFPAPTAAAKTAPAPQTAPAVAAPPVPTRQSAPSTAPPAVTSSTSAAPPAESTTGADSKHITARVVSIERVPNEMVLHLDNGQVWQEVQSVSGDLSLKEGDTVQIDKHLGSYWLSGPHVSSMKVRQKS